MLMQHRGLGICAIPKVDIFVVSGFRWFYNIWVYIFVQYLKMIETSICVTLTKTLGTCIIPNERGVFATPQEY